LAGFFLPLFAFAGLFGMNVDLPKFVQPMFWGILARRLMIGFGLVYLVGCSAGSCFGLNKRRGKRPKN